MKRSIALVVASSGLVALLGCRAGGPGNQPPGDDANGGGIEDASVEDAAGDATTDPLPPGTRDPALQPFGPESIWNMPVAMAATFEPAGGPITAGFARTDVGVYWVNQGSYSHQVFAASVTDPAAIVDDQYGRRGAYNINPASQPAAPGRIGIFTPSARSTGNSTRRSGSRGSTTSTTRRAATSRSICSAMGWARSTVCGPMEARTSEA